MITEIEILIIALIALVVFVFLLISRIRELENKVENLLDWSDGIEEWIESGGDHYMGLDIDLDYIREEIREEERTKLEKEIKGDNE